MPYLYKPAYLYYAAYLSSLMSFQNVFKNLRRYISNPEKW